MIPTAERRYLRTESLLATPQTEGQLGVHRRLHSRVASRTGIAADRWIDGKQTAALGQLLRVVRLQLERPMLGSIADLNRALVTMLRQRLVTEKVCTHLDIIAVASFSVSARD